MNKINKDLAKTLIKSAGIDVVIQSIIEMMDESIDATDYDIDSIRNPDDLWKFKVIEGLEHAYESYLDNNRTLEETS
jgi:hypothetical protein